MPEPPLPFGHASARWYYLLLKGMTEKGYRVTAFSAATRREEIDAASDLFPSPTYDLHCYQARRRSGPKSKLASLLKPCSYIFAEEAHRDLAACLHGHVDVLHLEQVWAGWLAREHRAKSILHVHNLWSVDLSQSVSAKPLDWLKRKRLLQAEREIVKSFLNVCCCSSRLKSEIKNLNASAHIDEIPAALDPSVYPFLPDRQRTKRPTIGLIGNMTWEPTYSAAIRLLTKLWPPIKAAIPDATIQIVGWGAKSRLTEFADLPGVTIEENVPEIQPYFEKSAILLYAPSRGTGMKIKVLEALAYGVPVVTTTEGIEGIPAIDGIHAGVSDDDEGLIKRSIGLLKDAGLQNRQRLNGRNLLETECSPRGVVNRMDPIYRRISAKPPEGLC